MNRTIICFGAPRSGTTAMGHVFLRRPDVGICHPDQTREAWEPNFWHFAAAALENDESKLDGHNRTIGATPLQQFVDRMRLMAPGVTVPLPLTEEGVFDLWDAILDKYGPIVFDKSPNYLGSELGMDLIRRYIDRGRDVRTFALVRDPRDAIASQYELWRDIQPERTPEVRERMWVDYYERLARFRAAIGEERCPIVRYEEFSSAPKHWLPLILSHCGLEDHPKSYAHIRRTSVGRYHWSRNPSIRKWKPGERIKTMAATFDYDLDAAPSRLERIFWRRLERARQTAGKGAKLMMKRLRTLKGNAFKFLVQLLPAPFLQKLASLIVICGADKLPPAEALRFLFRHEASLVHVLTRNAMKYDKGVHPKHRLTRYHDFFVKRIGPNERVLDIGGGYGVLAKDIAERSGARVTVIDLDAKNIETAREKFSHERVEHHVGDALTELPQGDFESIVLSNVLEHLPERPHFLKRVIETVRPGRILIRIPLFERDWTIPLKKELGLDWRSDVTHYTEYTLESFAKEMAAAGLSVRHQEVRWGEIWAETAPEG